MIRLPTPLHGLCMLDYAIRNFLASETKKWGAARIDKSDAPIAETV